MGQSLGIPWFFAGGFPMRVHFGEFALDRDSRQLWRGHEELRLVPKAFDLLDLLLGERPRAVSKDRIRDRLWPKTFVSESTLSPAARTAALAPGARLGSYEIVAGLGTGGMGEVYRARDTRLGREVAVKVVDPVWSPDGKRLAFAAPVEGTSRIAIFQKPLGGGAAERVLRDSVRRAFVEDWSRDGRFMAYVSFESGEFDLYVQSFPDPGPRTRISTRGGAQPRWRADGRELFYLTPEGTLMAADIKGESTLQPSIPRKLLPTA